MDLPVGAAFTKALPKTELHAHLSGSISRETLHSIWQAKRAVGQCLDLEDPAIALKPSGTFPTILSFFQIFNDYIYNLVNDAESISEATRAVVDNFEQDGVRYLELRTTPRMISPANITRLDYVRMVLKALRQRQSDRVIAKKEGSLGIEVQLILSIDRSMTLQDAMEVVSLAAEHGPQGDTDHEPHLNGEPRVLGIDLCGNPAKGDISIFTPAFQEARKRGLKITVHFAEIPASGTEQELQTLLDWYPDRLGHAIHIPPAFKAIIKERKLGLELCLSCNVLARLTEGGFSDHHFGEWRSSGCPIALGTDDVGVFESGLANEYLIAAREFGLGRHEVVGLARSAVATAFAGQERMLKLIDDFERHM